jgi:hypothetical protein|tara:strand:+ start:42 stop:386 length:345 start_codon:yes stop_codon:yes gene_type:complete
MKAIKKFVGPNLMVISVFFGIADWIFIFQKSIKIQKASFEFLLGLGCEAQKAALELGGVGSSNLIDNSLWFVLTDRVGGFYALSYVLVVNTFALTPLYLIFLLWRGYLSFKRYN